MTTRNCYRIATAAMLVVAAMSATTAGAAPPRAVRPRGEGAPTIPGVPFGPDQMFDRFFGEPSADEQAELAKIEISVDDERRFGATAVEAFLADLRRQKLKIVDRGREVDYLRDLVETLRPQMTHKDRYERITIYVVDSPRTDARSFPGGTLVFFRGLLDFADSEAALVGVVGHELSHLDRGHQLAPLRRMKLMEQSFQGGAFSPERMMSAGRIMATGFARPFRPEDESEADRDGATWAYRAGYDPRELAGLLEKLHRRDGKRPAVALSFLQTHPFHADRRRAIEALHGELAREAPMEKLYVGKRNLKERTARVKREFAE